VSTELCRRRLPSLLLLLLCLLLAGCGEAAPAAETAEPSAPPASEAPAPPPATTEPVRFAAGEVPGDTEELSLILEPGETALLDRLPALRRLDASGSECGEELCAWGLLHPQVELRYTVELPGLGAVDNTTESLDLRGLTPEQALAAAQALSLLPDLRELRLPSAEEGLCLEDALTVARAAPAAVVSYPVTLYGQSFDLSDTELVLFHVPVDDQGEAVRQVLPCMRACTWLDMDSCGVNNENMAVIRDENPEVEVIWRVWFGTSYSVRTNVTKILASMPSQGGRVDDNNCRALQYCTKVRYLDLGHNVTLSDFSFIRSMPELEVAVISMAAVEDLSPFASCPHLRYLEMGNTKVCDLSPLAACTELSHLNIGTNIGITDISPLYDLELKRLWIGSYTPVPAEQVERMQTLHPRCVINTKVPSGLERDEDGNGNEGYTIGWKQYQTGLPDWMSARPIGWYKVVFKCFRYDQGERAYAFCWNDPKYWGKDPYVKPVNVAVLDTSFLMEDWEDPGSTVPDELEDPPGETLYEYEH
jgi:hypothetical protein